MEGQTSKLAQALRSGRRAVIVEFSSTAADAAEIKRLSAALPSVDAVVVASDGTLSGVAGSMLLAAEGVETVLAISTGERNRTALLSDIRGAALLGVRNVLCVAGDHPSLGATPEAATTFDIDPTQLVQLLKDGEMPADLLVGTEVYPHLRPLQLALIDTRKKVAAGASFLVTQPIFDMAAFNEWWAAAREQLSVAVLAGVQAFASVDEAAALERRRHVPADTITRLTGATDAAAEGIAVCAELATQLASVDGVTGLYIRSSGGPETIAEVIRRAGLSAA
jgi:methylenetetrahydrofolate reductase (NADH)